MAIYRKITGWDYSKLVCLPKQWLQLAGLKKGDLIEMEIANNGCLILRPKKVVGVLENDN